MDSLIISKKYRIQSAKQKINLNNFHKDKNIKDLNNIRLKIIKEINSGVYKSLDSKQHYLIWLIMV